MCKVDYCEKPVFATGYCRSHYRQNKLYGDPTIRKQQQYHGMTLKERFFQYVEKSDGCWLWRGSKNEKNYGQMSVNSKPRLASRVSWQVHYGDIPKGLNVCHKCDNPPCVNPEHLFLGTQQDNVTDMMLKGRIKNDHKIGSRHNVKLTESQVLEIRASSESGVSLAARFGVTKTTISDVRTRKSWADLTD